MTVDYIFREKPKGPVTLAFLDPAGKVIRTFSSKGAPGGQREGGLVGQARQGLHREGAARHDGVTGRKKKIESDDSTSYAPSDSLVTHAGRHESLRVESPVRGM